jgi:hypothetical protein
MFYCVPEGVVCSIKPSTHNTSVNIVTTDTNIVLISMAVYQKWQTRTLIKLVI